jgi:prepilin-type N-terminal cleavage/methylation domain-containing protein
MPTPRPSRTAFTLVELLVVIAIIAVLIALLLPAIQKVREASNRTKCTNNMKQLSLAMHNYLDETGRFPKATAHSESGTWLHLTLPYLEQTVLMSKYHYSNTAANDHWGFYQAGFRFNDTPNFPVTSTLGGWHVRNLLCPSDLTNTKTYGGNPFTLHNYVANYGGNSYSSQFYAPAGEPFLGAPFDVPVQYRTNTGPGPSGKVSRGVPPSEVTDGLATTLLVSEVSVGPPTATGNIHGLLWFAESSGFTTFAPPNSPLPDNTLLSGGCGSLTATSRPVPCQAGNATSNLPRITARSMHPGGVNAANCDGSVRFVPNGVTDAIWRALGTAKGAEVLASDS